MELTKFTENMQTMLPQWMKMAKDPNSVGAQFLDSFGVEYQEVENYLNECSNNQFIGSTNIGDIDFCYRVPVALPHVLDYEQLNAAVQIFKDDKGYECTVVDRLRDFYVSMDNVAIIDRQEGYVYINPDEELVGDNVMAPFDYVSIDGTIQYEYSLHHIWNVFDEFGLLLGLRRLPAERNEAFKNRILDIFINPGNSTKSGIENAIARELNIDKSEIEIGSLADPTYFNGLMNNDGTPSKRLADYVDKINESLGFAWDTMNWGEAYWRSIEESQIGFYYLPHIWDGYSVAWKDHEIQSGVGDGDDLLVIPPQKEESVRNFKTYVGLRATRPDTEDMYPEIEFKYKLVAQGKIPNKEYNDEEYKYAIVASEIIKLSYIITAFKTFDYQTRLDWLQTKYPPVFEDAASPQMEIVTGETVLHYDTDSYVKIYAEMTTATTTDTPSLQELTVEWQADDNTTHSYTLTSANQFTQAEVVDTLFQDTFATTTGEVQLGFGEFYAVIDTFGAFQQGEAYTSDKTIKYNTNGSITLNI